MPNVQSEPRAWLAHFVLLGARNVTAMLVGSTALLGSVFLFIPMGSGTAGLDSDWVFIVWILFIRAPAANRKFDSVGLDSVWYISV